MKSKGGKTTKTSLFFTLVFNINSNEVAEHTESLEKRQKSVLQFLRTCADGSRLRC